MSPKHLARAVVAAAALAVAGAASAATITFQFTGTVTYGSPMAVPPGTSIMGSYSYDTETEPANKSKGYAYYQIPAPHTISASVGGHTITTGGMFVTVQNNAKGNVEDMLEVSGLSMVLDGTSFPDGVLGFVLSSAPRHRNVLHSTKLPHSINVPDFDAGSTLNYGILQMNGGPDGGLLQFSVDSITVLQTTP